MLNIPKTPAKRVVVVGGGFGGLRLCNKLANHPEYQVVLLDKNNFHQFPPLIYQVAASGLQVSSITFPFRKLFEGSKNLFFRMGELRAVYPKERYIQTSIGKLDYDYLVLATGTTTNYFGNKEIEEISMPMKTINEALGLRNSLLSIFERANTCSTEEERDELLNFIIVGGGPTGVEIAGALAEMREHVIPRDYPDLDPKRINIRLMQADKRLLPTMSETASAASLKYLRGMGVDVQLNTIVKTYKDRVVYLVDGRELKSQTIIWVCGVTCNRIVGLDDKCFLPRNNRIIVDRHNKVEGYDNIYAIGDLAFMKCHAWPMGHPQMAQGAIQQGDTLAENFKRMAAGRPLKSFEYKNLGSMATIGRNKAVADIFGMNLTGYVAWVIWMVVHLMSLIGVKNKISTMMDWTWSYFTYDKSNRTLVSAKLPKVIEERNLEISMRHWGSLDQERAKEEAMYQDRIMAIDHSRGAAAAIKALKQAEEVLSKAEKSEAAPASKAEAPKAEAPKAEAPKAAPAAKAEAVAPKVAPAAKQAAPKAEADAPKAAAKTEAPKAAPAKTEQKAAPKASATPSAEKAANPKASPKA